MKNCFKRQYAYENLLRHIALFALSLSHPTLLSAELCTVALIYVINAERSHFWIQLGINEIKLKTIVGCGASIYYIETLTLRESDSCFMRHSISTEHQSRKWRCTSTELCRIAEFYVTNSGNVGRTSWRRNTSRWRKRLRSDSLSLKQSRQDDSRARVVFLSVSLTMRDRYGLKKTGSTFENRQAI